MSTALNRRHREQIAMTSVRALADQAFSRAAGAPLVHGNSVRLLKDAAENYPAWLEAIGAARRRVHFESYIIHDDQIGKMFAEALMTKAREGVRVRLMYDWLGAVGKTHRRFWKHLRAAGVEVRCHNPPRFDSPFGWLSRDHRKMISVDGEVGFVTGLCVGRMWAGIPEKNVEPWRDTGVEVRGPAVADIDQAFAQVWAMSGEPVPAEELVGRGSIAPAGDVSLRIVASVPATAGLFRLDLLVAGLARKRLWLTDAYYAGIASYVQALRAAARDGVDVRLLVPGASDIPLLKPLTRSGYRPLLDAGVRVFEWRGSMVHAKTAVADGRWARVGSTNLNLQSWLGNCELDAVVEDERFAQAMEEMYLQDLSNATEIVLDTKRRVRGPGLPRRGLIPKKGTGSVSRAAAGALRLGNAIGASFTDRLVLEPLEARLNALVGLSLLVLAVVFALFPRAIAYPLVAVFVWFGIALVVRSARLRAERRRAERANL
jgi:cardiolipin synthase